MVNETNFIVRKSGKRENNYYIDYLGVYKITEISKVVGLEPPKIKEIYLANDAVHDDSQDVYYFDDMENAKKAVSEIMRNMNSEQKGRLVFLTEAEIEFIRKALINEGANTIHVKNKIKDAIFTKLNR